MQLKKSKTYKEQVEILRSKGLKINDSGNVSSFLNHVNYYRFSGYFLPFISKTDKKIHEDTSFEQLENIYYFDSELRKLIMGTILHGLRLLNKKECCISAKCKLTLKSRNIIIVP